MSKFIVLFLGTYLALTLAKEKREESPIVEAPLGKIRGSIFHSRLGRKIYSFRGVRYAEPPVGERRFKVPVPVAGWNDVYDGTKEGPACPTISNTTISEDCLRLNVYTTKLPSQNAEDRDFKSHPVLVFFHPGGFYAFSGQSGFFGPEYIMDKDIVLVTVNNRMGSLGFLSTGDSHAPGNMGLKDQVIALRWVKANIAAFGGDPNSVTISGYGVGSTSVLLHMVSPMSKGLFHKAIAMSGSLLLRIPYPKEQRHIAIKQAELLNCPTESTVPMINCLKTKPVENYTNTLKNFLEWHGKPTLIWSPVVEPEVLGIERFLPAQPKDLIIDGKINAVPLIIGTTKEEFGGAITYFERLYEQRNTSLFDTLNTNWYTQAPISFLYESDTSRSRDISDELRQFYFENQPIGPMSHDKIGQVHSDSIIIFPTFRIAQLFAKHSSEPVYFYKFTYHGRFSFYVNNDSIPYGVSHHDDLQYLFYMKAVFPYLNETSPEVPMVERYTSMWTSFARTGDPIPKNQEIFQKISWYTFSEERDYYLDINLQPTLKEDFIPDRMKFWDKLFPLASISRSVKS